MLDKELVEALKISTYPHESLQLILTKISDKKFDLSATDSKGNTYLHIACQYAPEPVVKLLINEMKNRKIKPEKGSDKTENLYAFSSFLKKGKRH